MKKIFFLFILISLAITINSEDNVQINDINPPQELKGSIFFPLFVNAKWIWNVKGMSDFTKITWEIISAHIINDITNNIYNAVAFKLKATFKFNAKEMTDEWYILEYDGFICFYKKSQNNYSIERIIPLNPNMKDNWINAGTIFKIAEINNNNIKVELTNEKLARYGYQLFLKDVGPYEIFEYLTVDNRKQDIMMSLVDNVSYKDIINIKKEEKIEIKEEKVEEKTVEIIKEEKSIIEITNNDYINSLVKDKKYLQIGSFNINYYAEELALKSKRANLAPKIFLDNDGQYKVLIEFSGEKSIIEKEIKDKLGLDSFLKK